MDAPYLLSSHAHICVACDHVVFLDLRRDEYSALDLPEAQSLAGAIRGWPIGARDMPRADDEGRERAIRELLSHDLITHNTALGKDATPISLPLPMVEIETPQRPRFEHASLRLAQFIRAYASVTVMLKWWPLERTVVSTRKALAGKRAGSFSNAEQLLALVCAYRAIQPRFFSPFDACLRNSLTLLKFLAPNGFAPLWVFGVRLGTPFSNEKFTAHSWLQHDGIVLNDTVAHVRQYVPILAV